MRTASVTSSGLNGLETNASAPASMDSRSAAVRDTALMMTTRAAASSALRRARHVDSGAIGQGQVQRDDIGPDLPISVNRIANADRLVHDVALSAQDVAEQRPHQGSVFDDEHVAHMDPLDLAAAIVLAGDMLVRA